MSKNQSGRDDLTYSASQKFIHTVAVISGVVLGSAAAFAVPEFMGVESLPQAVESLQAMVTRARQQPPAAPEIRPAPAPTVTPIAPKSSQQQPAAAVRTFELAAVPSPAAQLPVAPLFAAPPAVKPRLSMPQFGNRDDTPAVTRLPEPILPATVSIVAPPSRPAAVAEREALPTIPSPPIVPAKPVTLSLPAAPVTTTSVPAASVTVRAAAAPPNPTLAPTDFLNAVMAPPGDALVSEVAMLSPRLAVAPGAATQLAALPITGDIPLPRVRPDDIPGPSPAERLSLAGPARVKAERCLAQAVYFEARNQPARGQMAVAQVVINRAFSPYYPNDVCGVVFQNAHRRLACQFTFACDGKPETIRERGSWARAQRIARETLDGKTWLPEVAKSTHYHASYVRPRWVREMKTMARHGLHTFYRPRRWGDGHNEPSWGVASTKKIKTSGS